jgi:SpoIID/LytB domain protein
LAAATVDAGASSDAGGTPSEASSLPSPDDALEALYSRQINFRGSEPSVTVRLMEGQQQVTFVPRSALRLHTRGGLEKTLSAPAGTKLQVRLASGDPAKLGYAVQVADFNYADKDELAEAKALWSERGYPVQVLVEGAVYGIAGHVLDNRRSLVLISPHTSKAEAQALQDEVGQKFGEAALLHSTLLARPSGVFEVLDASGLVLAQAQDLVVAEDDDGAGFKVESVEHDVGYANHGFETRSYRGSLLLTVDTQGKLAVINSVPLEELLRGLVPAEIYATAHPEALKAQAVTARGEVLAKIGVRHITDPYLFCSDQHCQAYKGEGSEKPSTDAAIQATRGEALFRTHGGPLVDTVYSAVCGGYTESNEKVWAGQPNPSLRGVPDVIGEVPRGLVPDGGLTTASLPAFLSAKAPFACELASFSKATQFRWQKHFSSAEVDSLLASFKVGHVVALSVTERGVSGRAVALTISGDQGAGEVRGELNIRRTFKNLPSAMFVLSPDKAATPKSPSSPPSPGGWSFTGGGWGHGVGMCQIGAIGRAEHKETYSDILRHYFQDSELVKIY